MGKLDELRRGAGGNVAESTGAGVARRSLVESVSVPIGGARFKDLTKSKATFEVPVDKIVPDPKQPRKIFTPEELQDLSDSIRSRGLLQPIRVRWDEERQKYVIVAGERRWRASIMAGKTSLTCVVVDVEQAESEILHDQLVENCLRSNLQPIEQAEAFKTLMESKGWNAARLAEELHIRDSTVFKAIALLDLPGEVKAKVASGEIKAATAYELSRLDEPEAQKALAERVITEKLSRDDAASAVRKEAGRAGGAPRSGRIALSLDKRRKVTLSGLDDDRPETVIAALKAALKLVQAELKERSSSMDSMEEAA